jgi:hypothetical protein
MTYRFAIDQSEETKVYITKHDASDEMASRSTEKLRYNLKLIQCNWFLLPLTLSYMK